MPPPYSILAKEHVASIREIQKNPSQALKGLTRVMRSGQTIGFFFPNDELENLLEDLEALSSPAFRSRIRQARNDLRRGKTVSLKRIASRYGVSV